MPQIGVGGGGGGRVPAPPKPAPLPGAGLANVGGGMAQAAQRAVNYAPPKTGGSDILTSGPSYGTPRAEAFKQTPQYAKAVGDVFMRQGPQQQAAILRNLSAHAPRSPEASAIINAMGATGTGPLDKHLTAVNYAIGRALGNDYSSVFNRLIPPTPGESMRIFGASPTPTGATLAGKGQSEALAGNVSLGRSFIARLASDAINLPAQPFAVNAAIVGKLAQGDVGGAVGTVVDPFVQAIEHPGKALSEHPLLTPLMFAGVLHGATRAAAGPVRALASPDSAVGRAVATNREGAWLTGNLTHERAPFSKSPTIKAQQAAVEGTLYKRSPDGTLVPKTKWLRDRLLGQEIGGLVGVNERIRRVNQEQVKSEHNTSVTPGRLAKAAHGAKTALKYNPEGATVPGASVLARIVDGTIRRPETYTQDLAKHLSDVSENRASLAGDAQALKAHDAYVKTLQKEIAAARTPKELKPVFAAATAYAKAYQTVEAIAHSLGHFRDMGKDALTRRALYHYAATHLDATVHPELGLVDAEGKPMGTRALLDQAMKDTGGRPLAYTPDRVRFDANSKNSSFYVPSDRRPAPVSQARNTLYAYTHGLSSAGHDALLEQRALMRGVVDSHLAQNRTAETLANQMPGGGYAKTFSEAKDRIRGTGLVPLNLSGPFHPIDSLSKAMENMSPAAIEEEIAKRSLDLSARTQESAGEGRWAAIDPQALKVLRQFENQISPNTLLRTIRGLNNQFRTVALSTSAKHIPGVASENLIRDIGSGVGFRSWLTGRRAVRSMAEQNAQLGHERRVQLTGGQVAGMTEAGKVYRVSDHYAGTIAQPFLKAMETVFKTPGPRQLRTAWRAWTKLAIQGTKHVLEEQHQIAGLGKHLLGQHGYAEAAKVDGMMGLIKRAFGLHGQILDDAAKGLFDPAKARQARAVINQIYGKWTDLSPSAQTALMFSPFGLWWVNSAKFLLRMPVDMPVKTAVLAAETAGTQQQRQQEGLDIGAPGALPLYEQGGIPSGGDVIAQNYYSPFGVVNNPLETGASLIQPWALPLLQGAGGVDYLWKPLTAPGQNTSRFNEKTPSVAQRFQYILDSALASWVPLYTKAEQIVEGGASPYDVTPGGPAGGAVPPLLRGKAPATKGPGKGPVAGLVKAVKPIRRYKIPASAGSGGGGWGGGSSSSSSGGGWGGSTSTSSGGWG